MPAYAVEIEHRETDQVFSYYHDDVMLHFNATLLARLRKMMPAEFSRLTLDLTELEYGLCMKHRGIDEAKVAALTPASLRDPGYGVLFDEGVFSIIDGHHRLVRRWRGGVRVMDFWVTHADVWRHCLVHYEAEFEAILAKNIPPRVEDPGLVTSRVTLHPNKERK